MTEQIAAGQRDGRSLGKRDMICGVSRHFAAAAVIGLCIIPATAARAEDGQRNDEANRYVITNLDSDLKGAAAVQDTILQNSWGVAFSPAGSPFWIADNNTGCATLYNGDGTIVPLQVSIPLPSKIVPPTDCKTVNPKSPPKPTPAAPTGIVWNPSSAFVVPGTQLQAAFIFDTEDGTISAWAQGLTPATNAVLAVDNSQVPNAANGAVYKGLAFGVNVNGAFLFATNFRAGTIDVFGPPTTAGSLFTTATTDGGFADPDIPHGFAPFGIQSINGDLFVTYAKQNAAKNVDVAGQGNGFVDVFDTDGHLIRRFASRGTLNSPWGVARASFAFGRFSADILVGNLGDGRINVFNSAGDFRGQLGGLDGKPVTIDGLWTLTLGGGAKSSPDTLFFTAGPNNQNDGQFGTISAAADTADNQ
jgi:uncharacterized protein (TIGR03118 family)